MKAAEIRSTFLQFFASKGHTIVPSSSVVPGDDPTLLFTNAGMNQFKDVFLGFDKRPYVRAATSQKCIRAGGKHNDLENVGYTARHHTFFEMLGNFSFGDYFKKDALKFAWELLTEVYRLPADKLWATVYAEDDEAYDIWTNVIGLPAERVVRIGDNKGARYASDNFWMMGDTGPCGPCSEIFYDHGPDVAGGPPGSPEQDGDRYIEIWNNVFMQFNRDEAGVMHKLPKPSVDTGMGLERLTAVLQHVHSNYEIDLFVNLLAAAKREVDAAGAGDCDKDSPSLKVIADHIRACSLHHRRRRHPGQRRARLRAAPDRAARDPPRLQARRAPALLPQAGHRPWSPRWATPIPSCASDGAARHRRPAAGRGALLPDDRQRHGDPRGRARRAASAGAALGWRRRLQAARHLRLSARPHRRRLPRARRRASTRPRFDGAMDEQREQARARRPSSSMAQGLEYAGARDGLPRLRDADPRAARRSPPIYVEGMRGRRRHAPATPPSSFSTTRRSMPRSGGQVGDTGELRNATSRMRGRGHGQDPGVACSATKAASSRARSGSATSSRRQGRRRAARQDDAQPQRDAPDAQGAARGAGRARAAEGLAGRRRKTRFDFAHNAPLTDEQIRRVEALVNAEILENHATERARHADRGGARSSAP